MLKERISTKIKRQVKNQENIYCGYIGEWVMFFELYGKLVTNHLERSKLEFKHGQRLWTENE